MLFGDVRASVVAKLSIVGPTAIIRCTGNSLQKSLASDSHCDHVREALSFGLKRVYF